MTFQAIARASTPFDVPLSSIEMYLRQFHSRALGEDEWTKFRQSVKVICVGPMIEMQKLTSGGYGYIIPSSIPEPAPSASSSSVSSSAVSSSAVSSSAASSSAVSSSAVSSSSPLPSTSESAARAEHGISGEELDSWIDKVDHGVISTIPTSPSPMTGGSQPQEESRRDKQCRLLQLLKANLGDHVDRLQVPYCIIGIDFLSMISSSVGSEAKK